MSRKISNRQDSYSWLKWFPDDWLSDNALMSCSDAAQGVWMRILCRMWQSNPRGVITGNIHTLCRLIGAYPVELADIIRELETHGVFSWGRDVDPDLHPGAIVNRRMFREWRVSRVRAQAGKISGQVRRNQPQKNEQNANKTRTNPQQNANKITGPNPLQTNGVTCGRVEQNANKPSTNALGSSFYPDPKDPDRGINAVRSGSPGSIPYGEQIAPPPVNSRTIPRLGEILGTARIQPAEYAQRIQDVTGDSGEWLGWWRAVIDRLWETDGGIAELDRWVNYAADCGNPRTREIKGLGPLEQPGAFVASKIGRWARKRGLGLPPYPRGHKMAVAAN